MAIMMLSKALGSSDIPNESAYLSSLLLPLDGNWEELVDFWNENGGIEPEILNFDNFLGPSFSMNVYDHDQHFPYIPEDAKDAGIVVQETAVVEPGQEVIRKSPRKSKKRSHVEEPEKKAKVVQQDAVMKVETVNKSTDIVSSQMEELKGTSIATESIETGSPDPSSNTNDGDSDWDPEFIKEECSRSLRPKEKRKRRSRRINIPDEENLTVKKQALLINTILSTLESKRTHFSNRAPFIYKARCGCGNYFSSYVSSTMKHMKVVHGFDGDDFNSVIECIDDFDVIKYYPLKCPSCPFRASKQAYVDNHVNICHK